MSERKRNTDYSLEYSGKQQEIKVSWGDDPLVLKGSVGPALGMQPVEESKSGEATETSQLPLKIMSVE